MPPTPNVVITGTGLISALGLSSAACWEAVRQGRGGIRPLTAQEQPGSPPAMGGQAPDLPGASTMAAPREVAYLRQALHEALEHAGFAAARPYMPERCGIVLGTTLGGMRSAGEFLRTDVPACMRWFLTAAALQDLARRYDIAGFTTTVSSACSSGLASVGLAMSLLEGGELDLVVAGGYDPICEYAGAGFGSLRLVSERLPAPFSRRRDGMKLGESYALMILERADDARARGASVVARVAGYGETSDAHHLTQPHPEGDGVARAMRAALDQAGVEPAGIGLISAHATATPGNDAAEAAALRRVFGANLAETPVVAFKSYLGHTLGGAGAAELILAGRALAEGIHPATLNVEASDLEFRELAINVGPARPRPMNSALGLSLGFGGANSCVVLSSEQPPPRTDARAPDREVLITGVGVVLPGAIGGRALAARLGVDGAASLSERSGPIADEALLSLIDARRTRRMNPYVKLLLAATALAAEDAQIADLSAFADSCGALLGTTHISPVYTEQYYRQVVREGMAAANPMLFAEGVPNVGTAQISLMLGLRGPALTVFGSRTAGLEALRLAALRIRRGQWERAIVGAAEESSALVNRLYEQCRPADRCGLATGAGAVIMVLESPQSMAQRAASPRGRVERIAAAREADAGEPSRATARLIEALGHPRHVVSCDHLGPSDAAHVRALSTTGRGDGPVIVSSVYGHAAETFSVMPLVGAAAGLLTGRLPRYTGECPLEGDRLAAAAGDEATASFAVVARDPFGVIGGARLSVLGRVDRL